LDKKGSEGGEAGKKKSSKRVGKSRWYRIRMQSRRKKGGAGFKKNEIILSRRGRKGGKEGVPKATIPEKKSFNKKKRNCRWTEKRVKLGKECKIKKWGGEHQPKW